MFSFETIRMSFVSNVFCFWKRKWTNSILNHFARSRIYKVTGYFINPTTPATSTILFDCINPSCASRGSVTLGADGSVLVRREDQNHHHSLPARSINPITDYRATDFANLFPDLAIDGRLIIQGEYSFWSFWPLKIPIRMENSKFNFEFYELKLD